MHKNAYKSNDIYHQTNIHKDLTQQEPMQIDILHLYLYLNLHLLY